MKYFSTFSGIGGFELGIGKDNECVGYSEIDKYAIQIYQKHFPEHKNYGDITKIAADALPDFDFLCGGFPCQAFSVAGKRGGFEDTRGTLFFDLARILKAKQPRLFLFENVKGLLSHDNGKTFRTIIFTLTELGYDCQWQVLNSKNFGVPQNRERIFIIGHLRNTSRPQIFPFGQNGGEVNELSGHYTNTLTARYEGAQATGTYIGEGQLNAQVGTLRTHNDGKGFRESKSGLAPTIPARAREDGSGQAIIVLNPSNFEGKGYIEGTISTTLMQPSGNNATLVAIPVLTPDRLEKRQNGRRFKDGLKIRRLTPIECERLQGFPDNWTAMVSDTQRYKCLGNAVTVNVINFIIKGLEGGEKNYAINK